MAAVGFGQSALAQDAGRTIPPPPSRGEFDQFDPERAFDPTTGQNMFWDCVKKTWIDSKTGKPVPGGFTGRRGSDGEVIPPPPSRGEFDEFDPERAFDPTTGQNMFWDSKAQTWVDSKTGKPVPGGFKGRRAAKACPPPKTATPPLAPKLDKTSSRILDIHNAERAAVGAPALRWNLQLETDASAYAQHLASTGKLVHAPREGRGIERENLQQGLIGWSPDRMMQGWTSEKTDFVAGDYPNVARDGNWVNVSHYTQMIWPTTTDIGCGMAEGYGFMWLDCRYSPGGNKDGQWVGQSVRGAPERGR